MAPLPQAVSIISRRIHDAFTDIKISDISLSSFELAQTSQKSQFESLSSSELSHPDLFRRDVPPASTGTNLHTLSKRLTTAPDPHYTPGQGIQPYYKFNNKGYFALFALLGAAMVLASIWFFFWAKNGGFQFRQGDWEDYKSTVLRRKGPDGKTLSNATKSTKLGGGSVVKAQGKKSKKTKNNNNSKADTFTDKSTVYSDEMSELEAGHSHKHKSKRVKDPELAAYRAEKPARIGGINRQADGSHFDYSGTDPDSLTTITEEPTAKVPAKSKKDTKAEKEAAKKRAKLRMAAAKNAAKVEATMKKAHEKQMKEAQKQAVKEQKKAASPPKKPEPAARAPPSVSTGDDDGSTVWTGPSASGTRSTGDSYYSSYRPHVAPGASHQRSSTHDGYSRSRHSSPRKYPPGAYHSGRMDEELTEITEASSETGTKVYEHHIPGYGGRSMQGSRKPGYRRGGGGRRDSLSDSDGETGTVRS
ncbi:MAG: hypothetical protein M1820_002039 [Bogoriella megaspora]|nr:MAG: hypothetical protein M1820_002039 [Bogoriella megaspora]